MIKRTILLTTVFATLLSAAFSVQAENYNYYWKGGSGAYFTQSNWQLSDGSDAPVALSSTTDVITAYIDASGSTVNFDYSHLGAGVYSLTIGGEAGSASVTRSSGSTLTIAPNKSVSVLSNGTFTVNNTTIINAGGELTVNGGTYNPTGMTISGKFSYNSTPNFTNYYTITLNDGGTFNFSGGQFRVEGASAKFDITGGTATISSISYIGVTANGVINQSGGNATFEKALVFGWGAGNGTYNLSNGTLTTESFAGLWCAKSSGFNTFNVTGGTANFGKTGNSFEVGLYNDGTNYTWTPQSVANVFNLNSGTVNATDTFAIQYGGTLNVAKTAENTLGDGVLNAKAITLTNTGNLNMSSGTINVGEGGIKSSDGAYSITLSGGTFGTNGASWSSALNAAISANTVTFAPADGKTITWSGILSGAGGVTKSGDGTLTLVGANTYSGTTTISSGTLKLTGDGTLGTGAVVNEASLEFAYDTEKTFTNAVSGNGTVTKTGAGRLKINAANGFQTSELIVSNGRLDFLGNMTGGVTVSSNTVFSPGNSIGTADVSGLFKLESGATLLLEVDESNSDFLKATSFDVASGTIDLEMGSVQPGRAYRIIQKTQGTFENEYLTDEFWNNLLAPSDQYYWKLAVVDNNTVFAKFDANAVPEPSTWLLLVLGTAGLLYWRKKK